MPPSSRLDRQLDFLLELDQLKAVQRRSLVTPERRRENSAEHSWHLALFALVLAEHAEEAGLDGGKVLRMVLLHDIVEIDAGDTYGYDEEAHRDKAEREQAAARRLFGLLPPDQGQAFLALWEEFEAGDTPEARFANALDRFQAVLLNRLTRGQSWRQHGIRADQILRRNAPIGDAAPALWEVARGLVEDLRARGLLAG